MFKTLLSIALLSASSVASAVPQISIGSMYEFIEADKSTLLKRIRNNGDQTAYIRTEVSEIIYQGDGKKIERKLNANEVARGNIDGLVFTPSRIIIPAKAMQSGRLVFAGKRNQERYFRVRFTPVLPKDQYEFNQSKQDYDAYRQKLNAGINILTGFGAMVIVRPENARYNTQIDRAGQVVSFKNNGNSTVFIDGIKECINKKCAPENSVFLLPGKTHQIHQKANHSLQFILQEGSKSTPKSFG
jgi:P pilus assembly chaperone PapD